MRVAEFLEDYAFAFAMGDMEALADFYDLPLSIINEDAAQLVPSRAALIAHLEGRHRAFVEAGLARLKGSSAEEVGFDEGLGIVNIRWELFDRPGRLITSVGTTFVLRQRDGCLRIAGIIDHDDAMPTRRRRAAGDDA